MSDTEEPQAADPALESDAAPVLEKPDEKGWWLWWQPGAKKPLPALLVPTKGGELHACWVDHHKRVTLGRLPVEKLDGTWRRWERPMEAGEKGLDFKGKILSLVSEEGDPVEAVDGIVDMLDPIDCLRLVIKLARRAGIQLSEVANG